ncbi:glycoside hydrolase family 19 protein, partial [Micromonospora sp. NPDC005324]|uniref:glycoside hydrolase family 19 protein n=1 Tax=Micromonospora sp. NPDC005324 TaxID=3157033 RepID=UPI0033A209DF
GVLHTNGTVNVKEGPLNAGWVAQTDSVTELELAAASTVPGSSVTMQDLQSIWGTIPNAAVVADGLPSLNEQMAIGGITTPARKAAFLATLRHESGWRYNAVEVSNPSPYRGRGFVQLTGDFNYGPAGSFLGQNFLANPDAAASIAWSAPIARWYWTVSRAGSNAAADNYDMGLISRYIGYKASTTEDIERCDDFKRALRYYSGGSLPVSEQNIVCLRH